MYQSNQVRIDIYNILKNELNCVKVQEPNCVSVNTEKEYYTIVNYPFNIRKVYGCYEYHIFIKVRKDYTYNELKLIVSKAYNMEINKNNPNILLYN